MTNEKLPCTPKGIKTICIPCNEQQHQQLINDAKAFRNYIDKIHNAHPEIFPKDIDGGYELHGFQSPSKKQEGIKLRRIKIKTSGEVYSVRPSFLMPYMTAQVEDIEKALFLRRFDVPYWAIAYVFGRDDMFWYRLETSFGRNSIVGTTVKNPEKLPKDLIADEKHTKNKGDKVYITTTVGDECILGASISKSAGTEDLTEAYGVFKYEAENIDPEYKPETVNTDGWGSTMKAWLNLYPLIKIIMCFFHSFLSISKVCKKKFGDLFNKIRERVWNAYKAENKRSFMQRIRRFSEWAKKNIKDKTILDKVNKLCDKGSSFAKAYDYPDAHRTSNMLERLMRWQDQYLFNRQYFHGSLESAEMEIRAWAILRNFHPYCTRITGNKAVYVSAAVNLNGFQYRENWIENILVCASMCGYSQ